MIGSGELLGYTALEVSVDVAGIITACSALIVALMAHRRVTKLGHSLRIQRELDAEHDRRKEFVRPG